MGITWKFSWCSFGCLSPPSLKSLEHSIYCSLPASYYPYLHARDFKIICVQIYNPYLFFEIQCFHLFLDTCSTLLCTSNLPHRLLWRYYGDHSVLCMVASTQYSIIAGWNIDNRICTTFIHYYQNTWIFHKHVFNTHLNFYLFTLPFYTGGSYPPMQVFTGV